MPTKCILACAEEILLGSIVEELLSQSDGLELIEIESGSRSEVMQAIEKNQAEVLILCHKTHDTLPVDYLGILQRIPNLLIITVSTDDNYIHIYGKHKVLMTQSTDLLSVIKGH